MDTSADKRPRVNHFRKIHGFHLGAEDFNRSFKDIKGFSVNLNHTEVYHHSMSKIINYYGC